MKTFIVDYFGKLLARFDTNAIIYANDVSGIAKNQTRIRLPYWTLWIKRSL